MTPQDLAPDEREVWESLAPDERARVLAAWRTMYEMEGDSPLHLGWAMELAGVLVRSGLYLIGWVPDDMLRLNWDLPRFTTRVSSELQAYGFRWPPVDDEGPAVVPFDVYCGLQAALTWCEGDRFNWVLAAWFACELGWHEAGEWIEDHPGEYLLGVYQGFDFE